MTYALVFSNRSSLPFPAQEGRRNTLWSRTSLSRRNTRPRCYIYVKCILRKIRHRRLIARHSTKGAASSNVVANEGHESTKRLLSEGEKGPDKVASQRHTGAKISEGVQLTPPEDEEETTAEGGLWREWRVAIGGETGYVGIARALRGGCGGLGCGGRHVGSQCVQSGEGSDKGLR